MAFKRPYCSEQYITIAFKTKWLPKIHLQTSHRRKQLVKKLKAHTIPLKAKEATIYYFNLFAKDKNTF